MRLAGLARVARDRRRERALGPVVPGARDRRRLRMVARIAVAQEQIIDGQRRQIAALERQNEAQGRVQFHLEREVTLHEQIDAARVVYIAKLEAMVAALELAARAS